MKKSESSSGDSKNVPPRDIVERTFEFAARIVQLCGKLDERRGVGRVMMSQILRAGTSVPSNVEEAQAAQSKADFNSKMSIALKEARETHLRLRLLAIANIFPNEQIKAARSGSGRNQTRDRRKHCFKQTWRGCLIF
jgi:four helix bundle protein